jgi:hypothetical protein
MLTLCLASLCLRFPMLNPISSHLCFCIRVLFPSLISPPSARFLSFPSPYPFLPRLSLLSPSDRPQVDHRDEELALKGLRQQNRLNDQGSKVGMLETSLKQVLS